MSTHTPGPWKRRKKWKSDNKALEIYHPDRSIESPFVPNAIAIVEDWQDEESLANARLIAAAPELLEALEAVISVADRDTLIFRKAHEAIAKAKGEA